MTDHICDTCGEWDESLIQGLCTQCHNTYHPVDFTATDREVEEIRETDES